MNARPALAYLLSAAAIAAGAYYFVYKGGLVGPGALPLGAGQATSTVAAAAESRMVPAGAREYRSAAYHFSVLYPENLAVTDYDEGVGAATVSFQNAASSQGFQVFIVPYSEPQVTAERFMRDVPSGVKEGTLNISIGGVPAVSFYSKDTALGDTAEIWFIYADHLYEVTAPKPLAGWLSSIMATWQFI